MQISPTWLASTCWFWLSCDGVAQRATLDFVAFTLGIVASLRNSVSSLTPARPPQHLTNYRNCVLLIETMIIAALHLIGCLKFLEHQSWYTGGNGQREEVSSCSKLSVMYCSVHSAQWSLPLQQHSVICCLACNGQRETSAWLKAKLLTSNQELCMQHASILRCMLHGPTLWRCQHPFLKTHALAMLALELHAKAMMPCVLTLLASHVYVQSCTLWLCSSLAEQDRPSYGCVLCRIQCSRQYGLYVWYMFCCPWSAFLLIQAPSARDIANQGLLWC